MAANPNAPTASSPKQQYLDAYEMECNKTMRLLQAYPKDKSELRPHPKAKTARELAYTFAAEQGLSLKGLTAGFDWSQPPQFPKPPDTLDEAIAAFDGGRRKMLEVVKGIPEEKLLTETLVFPKGPGQMGDFPKMQFLWMLLSDQIHHRGQFSVYLRMADGKVPSIYGPSLDEPWM